MAAEKTCTPGPVDRCPSTHTIYYNIRNNSKTTCIGTYPIYIVSGIAVSLGSLDKKTNTTAHIRIRFWLTLSLHLTLSFPYTICTRTASCYC